MLCASSSSGKPISRNRHVLPALFTLFLTAVLSCSSYAQLNGAYTIDPNGSGATNYTSFGAAITALSTNGVSGPVTFTVAAATYNEMVSIPAITGASLTNAITFDGGAGNAASRIVSYNTNIYDKVWFFNGADYIRVKNLTIKATGGTYGYGMFFYNSANYNIVENCNIEVSTTSTNWYCDALVASGSSSYTGYSGDNGDYNLIQNNNIKGGYYCIMWMGYSSSSNVYGKYNQFIGNNVTDFYYYGMFIYYQHYLTLSGNTVIDRSTSSSGDNGIYLYYCGWGPVVQNNNVIVNRQALYAYRCNYYGTVGWPDWSNNMFVCKYSGSTNKYGAYLYYTYYIDFLHNSINLTADTYTGTSYGIYAGYSTSTYFFNNMIQNESTSGTKYLFYSPSNSTSYHPYGSIDQNVYYNKNTGNSFYFGGFYSSLAAWKSSYPSYNYSSQEGPAYYVSNTDLHSRSHVGYLTMSSVGVTSDIDAELRGNPVCAGADEYPQPPPVKDIAVDATMVNYASNRWARVEGQNHPVQVSIRNGGLEDDPSGVTLVYKEGSPPANSSDGIAQTFNPSWNNHEAMVTFSTPFTPPTAGPTMLYVGAFYSGDGYAGNDIASTSVNVQTPDYYGFEDFDNLVPGTFGPGGLFPNYPWSIVNVNNDATWSTTLGAGFGGSTGVEYPGDAAQADDWLITPAALLQPGFSYSIKFKYRSATGAPQSFDLLYGPSNNPANMILLQSFTTSSTAWQNAIGIYGSDPFFNTEPTSPQNYYFAIRVRSNSGAVALDVDDFALLDNPSPPPKIGWGAPGTAMGSHVVTQATPIKVSSVFKKPGSIIRTYEVVNATYNDYGGDFFWYATSSDPWIKITLDPPSTPVFKNPNPFNPPWLLGYQTMTIEFDPTGFPPGTHYGTIALQGYAFNPIYPNGIPASNHVFNVPVELQITGAGSGGNTFGQSATACFSSMSGAGGPYFFTDTYGVPFATVNVTSGSLTDMCITVYPNALPQGLRRYRYVQRYFDVAATGTGWTADIDWFYTDGEANAGGVTIPDYLRCVRQLTTGGVWEDPTLGVLSTAFPPDRFVRGTGYNEFNIGGHHALVTNWYVPKQGSDTPSEFALGQNYPNPFNPETSIDFSVPAEGAVKLVIYNNLGVEVATVVNEILAVGSYTAHFDASRLASGTYTYRLITSERVETKRMILSK